MAQKLGISVSEDGWAVCPFHDDHSPSLHFYRDDSGVHRWGCFPCGAGGDSFDLVSRVLGCSFSDSIKYVSRVGRKVPPPPPPTPKIFDSAGAQRLVTSAQQLALDSSGYLCVAADLSEKPDPWYDHLLRRLRWGVQEDATVVIPHYELTRLTGVKYRAPDGTRWSFPYSRFEVLYGDFLPRLHRSVVLTEGETDFAHAYRDENLHCRGVDVRGLPSGASTMLRSWPVDVAEHWDVVYLGLDADEAGEGATRRWIEALSEAGAKHVRTLPIPSGEDLRSCKTGLITLTENSTRVI